MRFSCLGSLMNFGGIAPAFTVYKKAAFVVIPVPYDLTSTYQSGSRRDRGDP